MSIFLPYSPPLAAAAEGTSHSRLHPHLPPASRILVKNLSYSTGEASLIKLFSKFGNIVDVKIAKHEETKRSKGHAFIQYSYQDDAMLAIENMDEKRIDGRIVYVEIAKPSNTWIYAYPKSLGPPSHQNSQANPVDHSERDHSERDVVL